jgi:hypothetical protein
MAHVQGASVIRNDPTCLFNVKHQRTI